MVSNILPQFNTSLLSDLELITENNMILYNELCSGNIFEKNIQNVTDTLKNHISIEEMYNVILNKAKYYYENNRIEEFQASCSYIFNIEALRWIYFLEN